MSRFKENWQWGRKRKIGRNRRTSLHLECLEDRTLLSTIGIVAENKLTGAPASQWDISGAGDLGIQGFAADISVNQGQTVSLKINDTNRDPYRIDIYRMGYYQGNGARLVTTVNPSSTQLQNAENQPAPLTDQTTGLLDAGNWKDSGSWAVPANATSGIYFAKVVDTRTGGASHIFFIVRDDTDHSQILYQTSDSTWEAYNDYGGNSLYAGTAPSSDGRAYKVSYNRPFNTRGDSAHDFVFNAEYPMVRWLEANGYDVSYFTDVDSDRNGALIKNHQVFMSNGHDEYWSGGQRANVEAARDAGTNLAFFSGNEIFWKTRWESSIDGSGTPYRTLVCYKETHANAVIDPSDPPTWTGTWRDPRFSPPADGGRPENALAGTIFMVNDGATTAIKVPAADGKMRFWRNTSIANLSPGSTATLTSGTLGYEWDEDLDNGARPAGLFDMSTTTYNGAPVLQDYGSTYASGTATHHLTLYRAPSGALVFGAGTVQWSWGLDGHHDGGTTTPNLSMQQATVNLFADMGVQPATLQSGLTAATASTDKTPPTSAITAPAAGTIVQSGTPVTITGTATDAGGGVVGGVEVSVDGGTTWHPATGRGTWSYTWTPGGSSGPVTIKSRAVDDSGNIETPAAGITVTVQGQNNPSGTSIFSATATPKTSDAGSDSPLEVGVKFRSDVAGTVTGIRFYKSSLNTGTHIGDLWSSTGTLLASAPFSGETASGWQQVNFATPVAIAANTVYVASYHTNVGHYAEDDNYFTSGVDSGTMHAPADGASPNGVYAYGSTSTFPNTGYQASNYWVDVAFTAATTAATHLAVAVPTSATAGASFSVTVTALNASNGTATGYLGTVHFTSTDAQAVLPANYTFTTADAGTHIFTGVVLKTAGSRTVTATDTATATIAGTGTVAVSPAAASALAVTAPPSAAAGVPFSVTVTARDLYGNTATGYTGTVHFTSGDAQAVLPAPDYTFTAADAGVHTFSVTLQTPGNQTVTATDTVTGSTTGSATVAVSSATAATHLAVAAAPASATAGDLISVTVTALNAGNGTATDYTGTVHFTSGDAQAVLPANYTFTTADAGTHIFTGVVLKTAGSRTVTATDTATATIAGTGTVAVSPAAASALAVAGFPSPVAAVTAGNFTVTARDLYGNTATGYTGTVHFTSGDAQAVLPANYTFTTADAGVHTFSATLKTVGTQSLTATDTATAAITGTQAGITVTAPNYTIWSNTATPGVASDSDTSATEVGVKFYSDVNGFITGIRFYKGTGNTGTHVGNLWTAGGTLLATATFTGESPTGWQQVKFAKPVPITAGTIYVSSYFAPNGHYADDVGYFASVGVDSPPLHALRNGVNGVNGVYRYGSRSGFPTSGYQSSNYWVDVVFSTTGT